MSFTLNNSAYFVSCGLQKSVGCSWLSGKQYLCYDADKGWRVRYFNVLHRFLRSVFGFYKSTHLDVVYSRLKVTHFEPPSDLKKCFEKIEALWKIKYQDKVRVSAESAQKLKSSASITDTKTEGSPPSGETDIAGVGNATLSQAQIVFFAEDHLDKNFHLQVGKWINQHYKEGDLILVEGVGLSAIVDPKRFERQYAIKPGCTYQGWEPENLIELAGKWAKRHEMLSTRMQPIVDQLRSNIPADPKWSDGLEAILRKEQIGLLKKFRELNEIYQLDQSVIQPHLKLIENSVDILKEKGLDSPGVVFKALMLKSFSVFEEEHSRYMYHSVSTSESEEILRSGIPRNLSLIEAVKQHLKPGKKVFVILGMSHILEMGPPFASCKNVQESIQAHPYIILTRAQDYSKIANLNSQMRPQIH